MRRDPASENRFDVAVNSPGLHAIWAYRGLHRLWAARGPPRGTRAVDRGAVGHRGRDPPRRADRPAFLHRPRDGRRHRCDGRRRGRRDALPRGHPRWRSLARGPSGTHGGRPGDHRRRARVLGDIEIGADAQIGANSVVVKPVPAGAVATGVPAQVRFPDHARPGPLRRAVRRARPLHLTRPASGVGSAERPSRRRRRSGAPASALSSRSRVPRRRRGPGRGRRW